MTAAQAKLNGIELRVLIRGLDMELPDVTVTDITAHSGKAVAGGLFLACAGQHHHGLEFIDQALAAQVAAVAWEPAPGVSEPVLPSAMVGIRVPGLRERIGEIADRFFAAPSAELSVTGITGTNGKTTTAFLLAAAMNRLNRSSAYMGTLGYGVGDDLQPSSLTTPGCIAVHRRLREVANAGAVEVVMEVSSHGLDQGRVDGVRFQTAALTNVTRDHLDYHRTLDAYRQTKARLFLDTDIKFAIINVGDEFGAELACRMRPGVDLRSGVSAGVCGGCQRYGRLGVQPRVGHSF